MITTVVYSVKSTVTVWSWLLEALQRMQPGRSLRGHNGLFAVQITKESRQVLSFQIARHGRAQIVFDFADKGHPNTPAPFPTNGIVANEALMSSTVDMLDEVSMMKE